MRGLATSPGRPNGHSCVCKKYFFLGLCPRFASAHSRRGGLRVLSPFQQAGRGIESNNPNENTDQHRGDTCHREHRDCRNCSVHCNGVVQRRLNRKCDLIRDVDVFEPCRRDNQCIRPGHWRGRRLQHHHSIVKRHKRHCRTECDGCGGHGEVHRSHPAERNSHGRNHPTAFCHRDL